MCNTLSSVALQQALRHNALLTAGLGAEIAGASIAKENPSAFGVFAPALIVFTWAKPYGLSVGASVNGAIIFGLAGGFLRDEKTTICMF